MMNAGPVLVSLVLQSTMPGYIVSSVIGLFGRGGNSEDEEPEENAPSQRDVRKNIFKAEQEIDNARNGIESCQDEYQEHIKKGATSSTGRRRVHAVRARIAKFKANIYRLKELKAIKSLTAWEMKDGMQDVTRMIAEIEQSPQVNELIGTDPETLQERLNDAEAQIQAELFENDDLMSALDVDSSSISVETTEEEELMDLLARGEVDVEDLEFDAGSALDDEDDEERESSSTSSQ